MHMIELETKTTDTTNERGTSRESVLSWLKFLLFIAAIFFIFRFAIGITVISGNSMAPTIQNRTIIMTSNLLYSPEQNDIIQFEDVNGFDVIKRIIAMPNDTVEINNGHLYVNGQILEEDYAMGVPDDMTLVTVPEGAYFVVGDNRTPGESLDSRNVEFGFIPKERMKGEMLFSLFPFEF